MEREVAEKVSRVERRVISLSVTFIGGGAFPRVDRSDGWGGKGREWMEGGREREENLLRRPDS